MEQGFSEVMGKHKIKQPSYSVMKNVVLVVFYLMQVTFQFSEGIFIQTVTLGY